MMVIDQDDEDGVAFTGVALVSPITIFFFLIFFFVEDDEDGVAFTGVALVSPITGTKTDYLETAQYICLAFPDHVSLAISFNRCSANPDSARILGNSSLIACGATSVSDGINDRLKITQFFLHNFRLYGS